MAPRNLYKDCNRRANRVGVMVLTITVFQLLVPLLAQTLLRACGVDTAADGFGLPAVQYLVLYATTYLLMVVPPLWLCAAKLTSKKTRRPKSRALSLGHRLCLVAVGVALCLIANVLAALFSDILYTVGISEPTMPVLGDGALSTLLLELIVFAAIPAVLEEWLLRGIVLETLRPFGRLAAVVASALLFGLMHGNAAQTPYTVLMGLVLGAVYVYTNNLRLAIAIHALTNTLALVLQFLLNFAQTETAQVFQAVILIAALMFGGAAALWLYRHPLPRPRSSTAVPRPTRVKAMLFAPFLWLAVLVTAAITVLRAV